MSFQDIESGAGQQSRTPSSTVPQSAEDAAFVTLQNSLSLQVFKMNSNVQAILKLVDQLGTTRDSAKLRKSLYVQVSCSCFLSSSDSLTPAGMTSPTVLALWPSVVLRT
jgi:hypothetical protein